MMKDNQNENTFNQLVVDSIWFEDVEIENKDFKCPLAPGDKISA